MRHAELQRRTRQSRSRWLVCRQEYQQRNLSAGVWFRLRRALAYADAAFAVSAQAAAELEAEGFLPLSEGANVEPPLRLIYAPRERVEAIADRRELAVRLSMELLAARTVALVPFDDE